MSCIERRGRFENGSTNTVEAETILNVNCRHGGAPPLELLAEVASAQLSCVCNKQVAAKKSIRDYSNLLQFISFSNDQLVKLFSELDFDELQKTFRYKCMLMPNRCSHTLCSYESEEIASTLMGAHIRRHLEELELEHAPIQLGKEDATAVSQSNCKIGDANNLMESEPDSTSSVAENLKLGGITTRLTDNRKIKCKRKMEEQQDTLSKWRNHGCETDYSSFEEKEGDILDRLSWINFFSEVMDDPLDTVASDEAETTTRFEIEKNEVSEQPKAVLIDYEALGISPPFKVDTSIAKSLLAESVSDVHTAVLDHDYISYGTNLEKDECVMGESNTEAVLAADAIIASLHYVESKHWGKRNSITQQLQEWEARSQLTGICNTLMSYVPIPAVGSEIETSTSECLEIQHEFPSSGDDGRDEQEHVLETTSETRPLMEQLTTCSKTEKEKALALKYLEDAHSLTRVKTSPSSVLECQICQPRKFFTAYSSLINHYRSHAGVKLFECKDCGKAFTRQHSLKYHTLIHSGATRFTCKECGWKGRHPFHFKEHKRRHTGEYPYQCTDCLVRFKTRNTYKRHLKARHNKILAPNGTICNALGESCGTITDILPSDEKNVNDQPVKSKNTIGLTPTSSTSILIPRRESVNIPLFQQVYTCVNQPADLISPLKDPKSGIKPKKKSLAVPDKREQNPSTSESSNPLRTGEQVDYKKMNEFMANNSMFNKMFISNKNVMTIYTQPQNSTALTYVTVKADTVPNGAVMTPLVAPVLQMPVYMQLLNL